MTKVGTSEYTLISMILPKRNTVVDKAFIHNFQGKHGIYTHLYRVRVALTCTDPCSSMYSTWALCFIFLMSYGLESRHCPFLIGFIKRLVNSFCVPSRFGFTKFTIV